MVTDTALDVLARTLHRRDARAGVDEREAFVTAALLIGTAPLWAQLYPQDHPAPSDPQEDRP